MPLNEQTISFFFFFTMQFYQHRLVGFPTKPKKILGPTGADYRLLDRKLP